MPETENQRIARIATEVGIDPPLLPKLARPAIHGDYLEYAHESVIRALAVIHMRLAKGDADGALELVKATREHLDTLWSQRREAAVREVKP